MSTKNNLTQQVQTEIECDTDLAEFLRAHLAVIEAEASQTVREARALQRLAKAARANVGDIEERLLDTVLAALVDGRVTIRDRAIRTLEAALYRAWSRRRVPDKLEGRR